MISDRAALQAKLLALRAELKHARVFESNLRFDLPDGSLSARRLVLRLRQDERARLTLKGPAEIGAEVTTRSEIEFEVSSFDNARALLEALGYRLSVMYEKYRTTYALGGCEVTLDEMPYGDFAEIEGPGAEAIRGVANLLGLAWETRTAESYLMLFSRLRAAGLSAQNLSFAEVTQNFPPEAFGLKASDAAA